MLIFRESLPKTSRRISCRTRSNSRTPNRFAFTELETTLTHKFIMARIQNSAYPHKRFIPNWRLFFYQAHKNHVSNCLDFEFIEYIKIKKNQYTSRFLPKINFTVNVIEKKNNNRSKCLVFFLITIIFLPIRCSLNHLWSIYTNTESVYS